MPHYRLLAVHAHPDDESSKGAATMARYSDEGHEVMVVTCTGGERGSILNAAMDRPEIAENLPAVRAQEMATAAQILGIQHRWLGYIDSGLPEGDPLPPLPDGCFALEDTEEAAAKLVEVIRDFRPHVMITYDEMGGYPHPDHIKTHAISVRAWDTAGDPDYRPELGAPWEVKKLYYTHGFVRRRYETFHDDFIARGEESPLAARLEWAARKPDIMERVTTQVPVGDWFHRRDDALRAHATQIDPAGPFFLIAQDMQRRLWPTEEFELAQSRVESEIPENDLFAGLTPEDTADHSATDDPSA